MNVPPQAAARLPDQQSPMAVAAACFAAGIWIAGHLLRGPSLWGWCAALLTLCAMAAVIKGNSRLATLSALLAMVSAGCFARVATPPARVPLPPAEFLNGQQTVVTGHVINDGSTLASGGARERFDVEAESLQSGSVTFTRPLRIRVALFSRSREFTDAQDVSFPPLHYGDRVQFAGKLRLPRDFRNPGAFDYEGYLHALGISMLASAAAESVTVLPGKSGGRWGSWRSVIRRSILDHINGQQNTLWSQSDGALFSAMILGDDSLLLRNVREEFQETGVYHLLVVSGMNVALLAFAVFWVARRLRAPEWAASAITIALAAFYAYVAGMGVPIQRAVLMLSVFLVARLFYRERQSLNATGVAALVVLVISPTALFEAGFQLTFLALLAIAGIGVPLLNRTSSPYRRALLHLDSTAYDLNLEPQLAQLRLDMRLIIGRLALFMGATLARWLVLGVTRLAVGLFDLVAVSFITQAVLVVPMRTYFHRAAIIGMPANVLVLPLAATMLNSAIVAIALSYVSMPLARVAGFIAAGALHWTLRCLALLAHLRIAQWRVPDPGLLVALLSAAAVMFALYTIQRRRTLAVAGLCALFLSAVITAFHNGPPAIAPGKLEVTAIDVGQGDSLLIVSPQGRTMLIDGGGSVGPVHSEFDFGEDVVSPYLWSRGLAHLDVVVLTHAHGDHISGLPRVVQNFHPQELWVGINPETEELKRLFAVAAENHAQIRKHTAGEAFQWGGAGIRVLSPPSDWQPGARPKNDDSLALLISYEKTSALLAGDLEKHMERFVAMEEPRADVLKVAHHGSATSTTPELLAAVQPRFAVVSDGYHNSFGHPRPEVLARLQAAHVRTFRTDLLGVVTFLLDGQQVEARLAMH